MFNQRNQIEADTFNGIRASFLARARCIFVYKNSLALHSCLSFREGVAAELAPPFSQQLS